MLVDRLRRRLRRQVSSEQGFSLVELVVASGVMALVFSSLAYLGTVAFADVALARSRETAADLANQVLEQVRALPYDTLALGLATSDLSTTTDTAVTKVSASEYRYDGERIPHGANAAVVPLVPHQRAITVGDDVYTAAVYVTYLEDDATSGAFRVTASVSWESGLRGGTDRAVQAQTVVGPCTNDDGGGAIHPFCAPEQPFLYANSDMAEGGVTITPYDATGIPGIAFDSVGLWLPQQSTNMQIEQIEAVAATARTSGVTMTLTGSSAQVAGRQQVNVGADSDPTQDKPVYETASAGTGGTSQSATQLSASGSSNSLVVTSAAGDLVDATATIAASATNVCGNAASTPVNQVDALPCGSANALQGSAMTADMTLSGLGIAHLVNMGNPGSTSRAHTNRDATPQTASCTGTSGDGCIHASHRQSVGAVNIGGLPAAFSAVEPAGFAGYVLSIGASTRTTSVEAGIGSGAPSATTSGSASYWNGVSYTTVPVDGTSTAMPVDVNIPSAVSPTRVSVTGSLRTGVTSAPACAAPCASATASVESPVVGDLEYSVYVGGALVAHVLIHIDYGTVLAHAEYTPSA